MDFKNKLISWSDVVNKELDKLINEKNTPEKTIYSAMKYSLDAGGKRLRPVLALAVCELFDGAADEVLPFACAIEMIHTYSLIHDDLPAMDNDDYRRGRPTNHKVYGEATAILAGDALLNYAFETMLSATIKNSVNIEAKVKAMHIVASASGASGMIGGQVVDLESEGTQIPAELLEYMHRCKTGALIKAPVMSAAVICGADEKQLAQLEQYSQKIGLAFQIKDDILDVIGNDELLGKKTGSDAINNKSTYVTVYGLDHSRRMLEDITGQAVDSLKDFGEKAWFLKSLAQYLLEREN